MQESESLVVNEQPKTNPSHQKQLLFLPDLMHQSSQQLIIT
jgi:hypothetical protein